MSAIDWDALGTSLTTAPDVLAALNAAPWSQPLAASLSAQLARMSVTTVALTGTAPRRTADGLALDWLAGAGGTLAAGLVMAGADDGSASLSLTLSGLGMELSAVTGFLESATGGKPNLLLDTLATAAAGSRFTGTATVVVYSGAPDPSRRTVVQLEAAPDGGGIAIPVLPGIDSVAFLMAELGVVSYPDDGSVLAKAKAGVQLGDTQLWLSAGVPIGNTGQPLFLSIDVPLRLGDGLSAIADLAGKLFGTTVLDPSASYIPGMGALADIELSSFSVAVTAARTLASLSFDVQTYREWRVADGLVLENAGVSFRYLPSSSEVTVFGTAVIGSDDDPVVLDASATIPIGGGGTWELSLSGSLGDDQPVTSLLSAQALGDGGGAIQSALGGGEAQFRGLQVNALALSYDAARKTLASFSLDIIVRGQVTLFGATVADPRFTLQCGDGMALDYAALEATLVFADGALCLQADATYQETAGKKGFWTFSTAIAGPPLEIARVWTATGRTVDELPDFLATAQIDALALTYRTGDDWALDFQLAASDSDGATALALKAGPGYATVSGSLAFNEGVATLGGMLGPLFGGTAPLPDGLRSTSIRLIALSYDGRDADPKAQTPAVTKLDLVLAATTSGGTEVAGILGARRQDGAWSSTVALSAQPKFDLGAIPLVQDALPAGSLSLDEVMVLHCSAATTAQDLTELGAAIAAAVGQTGLAVPTLPDGPLEPGLALFVTATAGGQPRSVLLAADAGKPKDAGTDQGQTQGQAQTQTQAPAPAGAKQPAPQAGAAQSSGDGAFRWVPVKKTIGPLSLAQIGFAYQDGDLLVAIDATAVIGGLTVGLSGFGAAFAVDFATPPSLFLKGLAVDVRNGPVTIGGGIQEATLPAGSPLAAAYKGELVVQTEKLGLTALGSYSVPKQGAASFFVFATADVTIGGPPFFYVTGLAGGFGVNRGLTLPAVDAVAQFPLVAAAASQGKPDADAVFAAMDEYLPAADGQDWLAAGVNFTSFQLVRSTALLTASFGARFQLALLGTSTLSMPPAADKPAVFAELGLRAVFAPEEGVLSVQAQLSPASYLFDGACRLTGGFAFALWFDPSPYAGDFVVTLGGYHPDYAVPDHFPVVPRLGFNWSVAGAPLTIQGGMYAALLPHCVMTGGELKATWQSGPVRAWFDVQADFLVQWKPFRYDARFGVNFGVEATIDLLLATITISLSVGAWLHVSGPPFAGTATVDLGVTSVTIAFGEAAEAPALSWDEFKAAFLPGSSADPVTAADGITVTPTTTVITPRVATGLLRTVDGAAVSCVLRPDATLSVGLLVPAGGVGVNGAAIDPASVAGWTRAFGVAPMKLASAGSEVSVTMLKDGKPYAGVTVSPVPGKGARALWGDGGAVGIKDEPQIDGLALALSVVPAVAEPDRTLPVAVGDLLSEVVAELPCRWPAAPVSGGAADPAAIIADLAANGFPVGAALAA